MSATVARRFDDAMLQIYKRAVSELGYKPTIFLQMLNADGGVLTAKKLINSPRPSDGYTRLYEEGRLDLTVEAVVIDNPIWHELFTEDELTKARARLKQYRYSL